MGITPDTAIAALVRSKFQLSLVTETWPPEITVPPPFRKLAERQWQVQGSGRTRMTSGLFPSSYRIFWCCYASSEYRPCFGLPIDVLQ